MIKKILIFKPYLLTLLAAVLLISLGACHHLGDHWQGERIEGSGQVIDQSRDVGYFSGIRVYGSGKLYITQGGSPSVNIQAEDNLMDIIETRVEGDTLVIDTTHPYHSHIGIIVYVTMSDIRELSLHGAWKMYSQSGITTNRLDLEITGAGEIQLEVTANRIFTAISGAGSIQLSGSADSHFLQISGAGSLRATGLEVKRYDIIISGAGDCRIFVTEQLDVSISGAGSIIIWAIRLMSRRTSAVQEN